MLIFKPIPNHLCQATKLQIESYRADIILNSYVGPQGGRHWKTNDAVIGLDIFKGAYVEVPLNQAIAYDIYLENIRKEFASIRMEEAMIAEMCASLS